MWSASSENKWFILYIVLLQESEDEHSSDEAAAAVAIDDDAEPDPSMIQGTDTLMNVVDMPESSLADADGKMAKNDD